MSNNVVGNLKTLTKNTTKVVHLVSNVRQVSVDIQSYVNRKTQTATLRKYLKQGKGFDGNLWSYPQVAELPCGTQYLFDGDHRRHLYKLAFPSATHMPAIVVPVKDKSEISSLFVKMNKKARKDITAEETFVHEVLAGEQAALKTAADLKLCSLSISMGTGEQDSDVGALTGFIGGKPPRTKIGSFETAIKDNHIDNVKLASETIQENFDCSHGVPAELLYGLSRVYKDFPELSDPHKHKIFPVWNNFMKRKIYHSAKQAGTSFKRQGGSVVNKAELCIAKGIMIQFKEDARAGNFLSEKPFNDMKWTEKLDALNKQIESK